MLAVQRFNTNTQKHINSHYIFKQTTAFKLEIKKNFKIYQHQMEFSI